MTRTWSATLPGRKKTTTSRLRQPSAAPAGPTGQGPSSTPWGSPSRPTAPRTCAPWPCCRCCSATWASPGGGVNALRGESNVQGSTDYGLLFHVLPGYLPSPEYSDVDRNAYIGKIFPKDQRAQKRQLVAERRQIHDQPAQGLVGRAGHC